MYDATPQNSPVAEGALEDRLLAKRAAHSPPTGLPRFARRAISVGRAVQDLSVEGVRAFVTIVVPTREFFASFVAIGAIDAALRLATPAQPTLEVGAVVRFLSGDKYLTGTYLGQEELTVLGEARLYENVRVGDTKIVRIPSGAANIVPATARVANRGRGLALHDMPKWLAFPRSAFGPRAESALLAHAELVSTVIGTKATIERELRAEEFTTAQYPGERWSLDRLLLPHPLEPVNQLTEIVAASGTPSQTVLAGTVILDGVNAIVRWGASPGPGAHVALIEPTSPALSDAAMTLEGALRFAKRRPDWLDLISASLNGLEWSAHEL